MLLSDKSGCKSGQREQTTEARVARRSVNVNTAYRCVETEISLCCSTAFKDQPVIVIIVTIG